MQHGGLVSNDLVYDMMIGRIMEQDCALGYILDGFPRQFHKRKSSTIICVSAAHGPHLQKQSIVIRIVVDKPTLLRRLTGRRLCPICEYIYNVNMHPPRVAELCDFDGARLIVRDDDRKEVVMERLNLDMQQSISLASYYSSRGGLMDVDGGALADTVTVRILQRSHMYNKRAWP